MTPIAYDVARRRLYLALALAHAGIVALVGLSRLSVDWWSFAPIYATAAIFLPLAIYAGHVKAVRIAALLDVLIVGGLLIAPVVISTYLAFSVDFPLADARLSAWDAALGFDWVGLIRFVDSRPLLATALGWSYASFLNQLIVLPLIFALIGQPARAAAIVFAYGLLCFVSSAISVGFPAVGAYPSYGVAAAEMANINTKYGFHFLEQFHAVRGQADFVLRADQIAGILTFPSVHAGVAFLCAWAAWPNRWLRVPFLVLNVAMAKAALTHGSHYLVDVIAGGVVAAVCVACAKAAFYRPAPAPAIMAVPDAAVAA